MAAYLSVANVDETEEYDFTLAASKVRLISGSLSDSTSEFGEPVELRFQTITKGTNAEIRTALAQVERIFGRSGQFFSNLTTENSIWIYANSDGERIRRALVMSWQRVDTVQGQSDPLLDKSSTVISDWIITRKGYWEATLDYIFEPNTVAWQAATALTSGACQAGTYSGTGHIADTLSTNLDKGTAPGRIRRMYISIPTVYTTKHFTKIWLGMKTVKTLDTAPNYFKPFDTFDNVYGATPTTYDANVNVNTSDSDALNGNCCLIDFTNNTWLNRVSIPVPYAGTAADNMAGTYQVLFRMRANTASETFRVAMFQAWDKVDNSSSIAETYQDVFVDSNQWRLYEMGIIQVPPENFRNARRDVYSEFFQLNIGVAAERITGSNDLLIDYLIWIPQEHAISLANVEGYTGSAINVITDEEDITFGYSTVWTPTWEKFVHEISATNWTWPSDPSRKIIAVMAADIPDGDGHHPMTTDLTTIQFDVIPRYHSYNIDSYS